MIKITEYPNLYCQLKGDDGEIVTIKTREDAVRVLNSVTRQIEAIDHYKSLAQYASDKYVNNGQ